MADWKLYTPSDLWVDIPPTEYLVDSFLPCNSVAVLSGDGGTFKTYTMLDIAVCVSTGKSWIGRKVKKSPVLIIDEESGHDRLLSRLQETMKGHGLTPKDKPEIYFYTKNGFNAANTDHLSTLKGALLATKAGLVIMDSLAVITPDNDENSTKAMRKPLDALQTIAQESKTTIGIIHHNNRNGNYRGASGIRDSIEYLFSVTRSDRIITIKADKSRDYDEKELQLSLTATFENNTFRLVSSNLTADTDLQNRIIEAIKDNPGMSKNKIHSSVGGNKQQCFNTIEAMERNGILKNTGKESSCKYVYDNVIEDLLTETETNRDQTETGITGNE